MKKEVFILCLAICVLFTLSSVCAADVNETILANDNANHIIEEINDDAVSESDEINEEIISSENEDILNAKDDGTFSTLQTKINSVDANSTIYLENDYNYNEGFSTEGITISKPLTIEGRGFTINGNNQARIFTVSSSNVIFKDISFVNGKTTGYGGAVYSDSTVTVENSNFINNSAYYGGAIYFRITGNVTKCNFTDNHAKYYGGAVYFKEQCTVENCNFINNKATSNDGGAIYTSSGKVINCNFINNEATSDDGGAVYISSGNLINCNFINNRGFNGGAVYFLDTGNVTNCNFTNNTAKCYGGAIVNPSGNVVNCNFNNNKAISDYGGGGAAYIYSGNVINCNFINNVAKYGGAIFGCKKIKMSNSYFVSNSAEYDGGAIYTPNSLYLTLISNSYFVSNSAEYNGGAIYGNITKSTFNVDFRENSANAGGAIYGNITDSVFNGDFILDAADVGGAIYGNITDSIFNGDFINNTARNDSQTLNDVLGSSGNGLLSFVPAISGVGGGICGNVVGTTLNTNFVMNTADVGAIIAGNIERSVLTGKISQNHANEGIIISGNVIKSIFTGDIEDILEIDSEISGEWLDSYIKDKYLNEKEREQLEKLQNLTKEFEFEIKSDLNIYVDGAATVNPNEISVSYHFDIMNFFKDKTDNYDISKLKDISNPLDGPLGTIFDKMLDDFLHEILKDSPETDFTGSTAYLTMEIKTLNNLKDAIQIANAFGLHFKDKYFKVVKQLTLEELCVKIAPGVYRGDKNKGLEIVTNYTLMKDGEGDVIIDAENNGNILTVKEPQITIDGLTFMHASDSAIIFEQGLFDSVINANFIENYRIENIDDNTIPLKEGGSAINFKGDIKHSTITGIFQNNYAKDVYSGTIGAVGHNIEDCIFNGTYINNTGFYTNGALLWCDKIINSIFSGNFIENKAYDNPGIIWANTIDGSTFSGNFINNLGIGLYNPRLIKCNTILDSKFNGYFSNNHFQSGVIGAGKFSNCIFDGVFKNNSVMMESYYGWGIIDASDTILKSIFNGNFIDNKARAVINVRSEEIIDCDFSGTFKYNTYTSSNGTIYRSYVYSCWGQNEFILACSDNSISSSEFDNILIVPSNEIYVDGTASSNGDGSPYNPFNNLKSAIDHTEEGDTIYIYPGTYVGENNVGLTINKSLNLIKMGNDEVIFDAQNNGRIFTVNTTSFNIVGLTFTHATDSAITFNAGIVSSMIDADFKNNTNKAALYITGRAINSIFNGNYIKNTVDGDGAAIHADSFILCELNANFKNNTAANGGAISGNMISSAVNGIFANNNANNYGGALFGNVTSSNFTNNFLDNKANGGGAIYGSVSSCNFNSDFINNQARLFGGAIAGSVSSSYFIANFINNDAEYGGVVDGDISKSFFKGEFIGNGAEARAGKIAYADYSIIDSKFIGEIFASNSTNMAKLIDCDNVIGCIFNNLEPIDEKDMSVPALPNSTGESVTVKLPNDAKGTIKLDIGGESYNFDVIDGVANVQVPDLANGVYPYSIIYSGDDNYAPFTKTGSLTINNSTQNPTNPTDPTNPTGPTNLNTQTSTTKKTTKTTLTLKKVKVKKSAKKLVISATLKINGKAVKGKIIKFKFNKKTYKAKTNKKGVAKITIKKAVLKKLKAGKKVTYTATYGKITKKVTVNVKK